MNELKINGTMNQTITTLEIADMLEMKHYKILEKLEGTKDGKTKGIIEILNAHDFVVVDYFIKSSYKDSKGEIRPCYLVTKLGCDFLANKFTGEKGIIFTAKYVKRFDEMEQQIKNSYKLPTTYKEALLQLVEQVEENEKLLADNNHKQEVINGFTDDTDIYKKKDIINRICKRKNGNYANKYKELYKCFRENFHIDLEARCEGYNLKQTKKKDRLSVIKYAEQFGYIDDLYSCCTKLFEAEIDDILDEINKIHS
jgi:phage regulator Rha-like protein